MRVLIVDDEPKVRQHLRMLLNTRNVYEIVGEACDGAEALKMMDAAAPDIVITDIRMPRMDGLQLLKEIQRQGFTVGRIVLTGYGDFAYTRRAMQQGIRTYLLKPIDEAELWKAMEEAVQDLNHEKLIMHQLKCGEKQRRSCNYCVCCKTDLQGRPPHWRPLRPAALGGCLSSKRWKKMAEATATLWKNCKTKPLWPPLWTKPKLPVIRATAFIRKKKPAC